MVERIRTLLETRQLTPTQFADVIGIARPIVSHILSGRNKPSLEVVQRILAAMPDLSMPWLLNGTGPMLANTAAVPAPVPAQTAAPVQVPSAVAVESATLPPTPTTAVENQAPPVNRARRAPAASSLSGQVAAAEVSTRVAPKRFAAVQAKAAPLPAATAPVTPLQPSIEAPIAAVQPPEVIAAPAAAPVPAAAASSPNGEMTPTAAALLAGAEKPIRRIVIFYRDGSFADYRPE